MTFSLVKLFAGTVLFPDESGRHSFSIRLPIRKSPVSKAAIGPKRTELLSTQIMSIPGDVLAEIRLIYELSDAMLSTDEAAILIIDRSKDPTQFLKRTPDG